MLQLWLPLDGNLKNNGVTNADVVNNGATVSTSGKIGSCYSFDGENDYISITDSALYKTFSGGSQPFTVAMWVYHADTTRAILFGDYSLSGSVKYNIELTPTHNIRFYWNNGSPNVTTDYAFAKDTWTHIAITYDGTDLRFYSNGALVSTRNGELPAQNKTSGAFYLGRDNRTGTTTLNGRLNDFRVYDNCLTQAEIREIAKGLVLHYKLNSFNDGFTGNLLWQTPKSYNPENYLVYQFNMAENLQVGETYTLQLWNVDISNSDKTDSELKLSVWWGGWTCNLFHWTGNGLFTNGHADYLVKTFTVTQAHANKTGTGNAWLNLYNMPESGTPKYMYVGKWQLEKGDTASSYFIGVDGSKIVDNSGYSRHGKVEGSIKFLSESKRYGFSYVMDGTSANRIHYDEGTFNYTDNFSYALWVKPNRTGENPEYVFTNGRADTGGYGYGMQVTDTGLAFKFGSKDYQMSVTNNEWVHIAFVKSGTTIKIFKNGEVDSTDTFDGMLPTYSDGNGLGIGNFHYTSDIYPAYGNVSDFRIYCTPLSDADIKDLYQTSLKIDNGGKFHTFELVESNSMKIGRNGEFQVKNVIEKGLFNKETSYSITATSVNNYNYRGTLVEFNEFADLGMPLTISVEFDLEWSDFTFDTSQSYGVNIQGPLRVKSDGTSYWGNNYITSNFSITSALAESTSGSAHFSKTQTIPASWFETYDAAYLGIRSNYGSGTIEVKNIKVTIASNNARINGEYISGNEIIER